MVLLLCVASACRTGHNHPSAALPVPVEDRPAELREAYRVMNAEGGRNFVVNQMEIGLDAFQLGYRDLSSNAFDEALNAIESVFGWDAAAKQARRLWHEEGRKTFKGEPYERAMTYYYRGLLYIHDGDLENARACFRGGMQQDAFVEEEQHRNDFASLLYLEAWCSLMLGDRTGAEDPIRFLAELRPDCPPPAADDNVLIVAETGTGPRKIAAGPGESELRYARGWGLKEKHVKVSLGSGKSIKLYPIEDVYWQASTRGGRPVDHILKGKVVFKQKWDATGTVLTETGLAGVAAGSQMRGKPRDVVMAVSGGVAALGLLSRWIAAQVRPRADTRRFRSLPDAVHVAAASCPAGECSVKFRFNDEHGRPVTETDTKVSVSATPHKGVLVWARSPQQLVAGR